MCKEWNRERELLEELCLSSIRALLEHTGADGITFPEDDAVYKVSVEEQDG